MDIAGPPLLSEEALYTLGDLWLGNGAGSAMAVAPSAASDLTWLRQLPTARSIQECISALEQMLQEKLAREEDQQEAPTPESALAQLQGSRGSVDADNEQHPLII